MITILNFNCPHITQVLFNLSGMNATLCDDESTDEIRDPAFFPWHCLSFNEDVQYILHHDNCRIH